MKNTILFGGNIMLFIVLSVIYTITSYGLGYASNDSYDTSAWILLGTFVIIHLLANGLLLYKLKMPDKWVVISSNLMILFLYGFLIWAYRPVG